MDKFLTLLDSSLSGLDKPFSCSVLFSQNDSFFIVFSVFNLLEYSMTCSISLTRLLTSLKARVILRSGETLLTLSLFL